MHIYYNPNPEGKRVGDCVIRALSKALGQTWEHTYIEVIVQGLLMHDMPSADHVWGKYLMSKGFKRSIVPSNCPACYTVRDFCADHPQGTYILSISGHAVCTIDGSYYDTFDSGDCTPLYYWEKRDV